MLMGNWKRMNHQHRPITYWYKYLFLFLSQAVPHRCHNLWHLPEGGTGVLAFNCCLGVPEEEGIRWNRLLWLIGVFLLPPLLVAHYPRDRERCRLLGPASLCCCRGRHRNGLGRQVQRCSRRRQWHGRVYQHAPLDKARKDERRNVSEHGSDNASVQYTLATPTLKSSISSSCRELAGEGVADRGCSAAPEWCLMFSVPSPNTSSDWLIVDRWLLSKSPWPMSPRWTSIVVGEELLKCEPPEFPSSCRDQETIRNQLAQTTNININ